MCFCFVFCFFVCFFFFFQAEDGIRDAQESRGLGDVYKGQVLSPLWARAQLRTSPRWGPSHALSFVVRHVDAAARSQTSRLVAMVSGNRLCEELGVSVHVAPYVGGPRQPSTATPPTIYNFLRFFAAASSST